MEEKQNKWLKIIDKVETKNAERLENLIELSRIRNISLDVRMS